MKLKKSASLILISFFGSTLALTFQNCSQVAFSTAQSEELMSFCDQHPTDGQCVTATPSPTPAPSATPSPTATPAATATPTPSATPAPTATPEPTQKTRTIDVTGTQQLSAFNLLIVVDDSYSMTANNAKVANNLDSLLEPLANRDVHVKVITLDHLSDDRSESKSELFEFPANQLVKGNVNGTVWNYFGGNFYSRIPYNQNDLITDTWLTPIKAISRYTETKGQTFALSSTDSADVQLQKRNQIKEYIKAIPPRQLGGTDYELGFCPLMRHIANTDAGRFLSNNNPLGVILISDENDSMMSADNCLSGKTTQFDAPENKISYDHNIKMLRVQFQYTGVSDGVPTPNRIGYYYAPLTVYDYTSIPEGNCPAGSDMENAAVNEARKNVADFVFIKCEVVRGQTNDNGFITTIGGDTSVDYCDTNNKFTPIAQYSSYAGADGFATFETVARKLIGNSYVYTGGCRKTATKIRAYSSTSQYYAGISTDKEQFGKDVVGRYQQRYGDKVFFAFIIHPSDQSCALDNDQSVGTRYKAVADQYSGIAMTHPICSNSYNPAMNRLSNFAVQNTASVFPLNLEAGSRVLEVSIIRNGTTTVLDATQYSANVTEIHIYVPLSVGDQIKVKYQY